MSAHLGGGTVDQRALPAQSCLCLADDSELDAGRCLIGCADAPKSSGSSFSISKDTHCLVPCTRMAPPSWRVRLLGQLARESARGRDVMRS